MINLSRPHPSQSPGPLRAHKQMKNTLLPILKNSPKSQGSIAWALLFVLLSSGSLSAQAVGSVRGTIDLTKLNNSKPMAVEKYVGKISGRVDPAPRPVAGVWLTGPNLAAPQNPSPKTLAQKGYQFATGMLVIPRNTTVFFPNRDPEFHNVYSLSRTKRFDIGRYKKDAQPVPSVTFDKAGYVRINCEIHEHMQAHVLVVDSPIFTVSDAKGAFTLKNVPPGQYTIHAQSDKKNKWQRKITVLAKKETVVALGR